FFDMDGDGRTDIVYVRNGRWYKRTVSGGEASLTTTGASQSAFAHSIDYNGDGQRDLLVADSETSNWKVLSFEPTTTSQTVCEPNGNGTYLCEDIDRVVSESVTDLGRKAIGLKGKALVADVNGDALEDIIFIDGGAIKWYRNQGGSFAAAQSLYSFPSTELSHSTSISQWDSSSGFGSAFMDINGDGLTDFMLQVRDQGAGCSVPGALSQWECERDLNGTWSTWDDDFWNLYVSNGSSYSKRQEIYRGQHNYLNIATTLRSADFNGDGLSDIAYVKDNKWYIQLSDGIKFLPRIDTGITTNDTRRDKTAIIDLNGDGRAEFLVQHSDTQSLIYHSARTGTNGIGAWSVYGVINETTSKPFQFADVDGLGKLDIVYAHNDRWYRLKSQSHSALNAITRITDGLGVNTHITYAPLTEKAGGQYAVYKTQVSSHLDPARNFSTIPAQWVVKRVSTETGPSTQASVNYEYGGLLINRLGRGPAGFELLRTIDNQTGVNTETLYHQVFPQVGMPLATRQSYQGEVLHSAIN
ncbi:FG-GAP-like repeat-containing protein, partial [Shewanella sp. NIFS-20-20]|uniref:FG-GAP-like repeat-containing protein n=1 Tax=Shewanella sp. NIFS-20-20 TaxID=2853806 RepID=UPI001C4827C3